MQQIYCAYGDQIRKVIQVLRGENGFISDGVQQAFCMLSMVDILSIQNFVFLSRRFLIS